MTLNYTGGYEQAARQVAELEKVGLDVVWVAEAYSFDAPSVMGYLAAKTERVEIGSAILPIYSRTPTLLAMTAAGLDAILGADKGFDPRHFLTGARTAYEMIVVAFAQGDRRTLRDMLSKEVLDGFDQVIREREGRGETAETRFVSIDTTEIAGAELRGRTAQVTVRFVSQLVSVTRDKTGNVTDGNPDKVTDVTDIWTFARDVTSRDPNWKLVATDSGH